MYIKWLLFIFELFSSQFKRINYLMLLNKRTYEAANSRLIVKINQKKNNWTDEIINTTIVFTSIFL